MAGGRTGMSTPVTRRLLHRTLTVVLFVGCIVLFDSLAVTSAFARWNTALQAGLFLLVAGIPAWRTRKMSFVDVAWPWGLVLIAVGALLWGDGWPPRQWLIGAMYACAGFRMGLPGLRLLRRPHLLRRDFPRYQYQRLRWDAAGHASELVSIQYEIALQALFNASLLAVPALLLAINSDPDFALLEIAGALLWVLALTTEIVADRQKAAFMRRARAANERHANCDVGLWRYSRHPNYFGEWMVWNSLILMSVPSVLELARQEGAAMAWYAGLFLVAASPLMYWVLVHYTGAVPAEHFSALKRPGYPAYQAATNRFFPGRPGQPEVRRAGMARAHSEPRSSA